MLSAAEKKELKEVLEYIQGKIKDGFPFKDVQLAGAPDLDEDGGMVGIAVCDGRPYTYGIPQDDPRPVLQPLPAIQVEEE